MHRETRQFGDGRGGHVTGIISYPDHHRATNATAVVLAHGAGTDMTNPLLVAIHDALARHGYPSVRFNFPYKEHGRRAPDPLPVLKECFRSVIAEVRATPQLSLGRLFIGGKSLGGRVASYLQAEGAPVSGLLFLGYPLHPAGKPERLRVDHLARITVPMLFLVGTRDPLCRLDLLHTHLRRLTTPITIHVLEDGDHSFNVLKRTGRTQEDVTNELIDVSIRWLRHPSLP